MQTSSAVIENVKLLADCNRPIVTELTFDSVSGPGRDRLTIFISCRYLEIECQRYLLCPRLHMAQIFKVLAVIEDCPYLLIVAMKSFAV